MLKFSHPRNLLEQSSLHKHLEYDTERGLIRLVFPRPRHRVGWFNPADQQSLSLHGARYPIPPLLVFHATGKKVDTVWFADGDASNLRLENLRWDESAVGLGFITPSPKRKRSQPAKKSKEEEAEIQALLKEWDY